MPLPLGAIGATVLPNVGGWVGGVAVMKSYSGWYKAAFAVALPNVGGFLGAMGMKKEVANDSWYMTMSTWKIVAATLFPQLGAAACSFKARKEFDSKWNKTLKKPSWTPPRGAFGPVWTMLYSGMGYASYLVWRDGGGFEGAALPLTAYATQLALNWAWTPIFFGCHSPKWGLVNIMLLTATAGATSLLFFQVNQTAGLIMIPYLGWLGVATSLNYWIYTNNREDEKEE